MSLKIRLISTVDCIPIHKALSLRHPRVGGEKVPIPFQYGDYSESGLDNKDYSRFGDDERHEKKGRMT